MSDSNDCWTIINHNTIKNNTAKADEEIAFGGGIYMGRNAIIKENIIANNHCNLLSPSGMSQGGGIYTESLSWVPLNTMIIDNNIIKNNLVEGGIESYGGGLMGGDTFPCPVLHITNNVFENNETNGIRGWGTAMFLTNINGNIIIENNSFNNNSANTTVVAGATIYLHSPQGETKILNNIFSNNTVQSDLAWGSVIWIWDAEYAYIEIDGNQILNNTGDFLGGFYARNSYNYHLTNNIFSGNIASGNIYDNTAGAIYLHQYYDKEDPLQPFMKEANISQVKKIRKSSSVRPLIANNTFVDNYAENNAGAIGFSSTYDSLCPIIINNIFWENEASTGFGDDICYFGSENLQIEFNDINTANIYGNYEGNGNMFMDPMFIDNLYHLDSLSPCINQGLDSLIVDGIWYHAPQHDFDGNPRPDTICYLFDIGAYERQECWSVGVPDIDQQTSGYKLNIYPNPVLSSTTIEYELTQPKNVNITIFNHLGQQVEIIDQGNLHSGQHQYIWDASGLPNGIYFVQVRAGHEVATKKIVKMK